MIESGMADAYTQRELHRLAAVGLRQSTLVAALTMPLAWIAEVLLRDYGFGSSDLTLSGIRAWSATALMLLTYAWVHLRRDEIAHPFMVGTLLMWVVALGGGLAAAATGGYDSAYAVAAVPILVIWTLLMPGGVRYAAAPLVGGFLVYQAALYFYAPPSESLGKTLTISLFQAVSVVVAMVFCQIFERLRHQLLVVSSHDALTGLLTRGYILSRLEHLAAKRRRHPAHVSAVMVDLDHFKRINDEHGHAAGDEVLRTVAHLIRSVSREEDLAGRWGGEEFLLALDECDQEQARQVAERLREALAATPIRTTKATLHATLSAGVACAEPGEAINTDLLVRAADEALYEAKGAGRNRVCLGALRPAS